MNILVVDAQGGGMGKMLVAAIKQNLPGAVVTAVGTNTAATSAMLKAGVDVAATGENAVVVGARSADVIVGPVGIAIADSLHGEITPRMAVAIGRSAARRILIPLNQCNNIIAGVSGMTPARLVQSVLELLQGG